MEEGKNAGSSGSRRPRTVSAQPAFGHHTMSAAPLFPSMCSGSASWSQAGSEPRSIERRRCLRAPQHRALKLGVCLRPHRRGRAEGRTAGLGAATGAAVVGALA